VLKRFWILIVLLALLPLSGCKKSEGTKIENFFGAPPTVSEVSLTKERRDYDCVSTEDLCTCCCAGVWDVGSRASIDLLTASAKVVDTTPPTPEHPTDILVVVLRFLDPPLDAVPPGTTVHQFSLEMFDTGTAVVGTLSNPVMNVFSGDLVADDQTFTRKFYFGNSTELGAGECISLTDLANLFGTYSTYSTSLDIEPSGTLEFDFTVQAIDRSGNIATSTVFPLPIQGTFRETVNTQIAGCIVISPGVCSPP